MKQHYRKQDGFFQCNHCEISTKFLGHIKEHTQKHIQNLELDCDSCGKIFQGTKPLRRHKGTYHPKYKDTSIEKTEQGSVNAPVQTNNDDSEGNSALSFPIFCRIKGQPLSKDHLYELLKEYYYKQGMIYKCAHCEYNTKCQRLMRDHTHCHVKNLEFECDICGKIVHGTNALRAHKHRQHSEVPEDALVCKTCNIQFKSQGRAKYHYKKTHPDITFPKPKNVAQHDMKVDRYASIYVQSM